MSYITLSKRLALLIAFGLSLTSASYAQIALNDDFTMSGFGTFTAAKSDNETPLFLDRDITNEWCFDCDSTLGVQLNWVINSALRSTIQVVKRPQDTFSSPEIERAFIEYATENTRTKVGRLRTPLFIMSEYYYVSSAYPWVRLPADVYFNHLGITHYDGASADFLFWLDDESQVSISPFIALPSEERYTTYGRSFTLKVSHAVGVSAELYHNDNLYRISYTNSEAEQVISPVIKPKYKVDIYSLGMSRYFGNLHVQAETVLIDDIKANWYLGLDYQWNNITPYVLFGQSRRGITSNSYTLGARYDWTDRINTSIEWQRVTGEEKVISGQFTLPQDPTEPLSTTVDVFTVGLSFTF